MKKLEKWEDVKKELLKDKNVALEYKKLEPRYQLISKLIRARLKSGLTQKALAQKIGTKQSAIARLEAGRENISIDSLEKISQALGVKIKISIY